MLYVLNAGRGEDSIHLGREPRGKDRVDNHASMLDKAASPPCRSCVALAVKARQLTQCPAFRSV